MKLTGRSPAKPAKSGKSFSSTYPPGSTISRSPAVGSLAETTEKTGSDSEATIRANAKSYESSVPIPHTYTNPNPSIYNLRVGPNYAKNKLKAPSSPPLYDLYTMDVIRTETLLRDVTNAFQIPVIPGVTDIDTGHPHVPPMLVMNCNMPAKESIINGKSDDKSCYIVVMIFLISPQTLDQIRDLENASPAVKLFCHWAEHAENNIEVRGRLKAMCILDNIEKLGIPPFIANANGKPCLIVKSGTVKKRENYMEVMINIFLFSVIAKKCLYSLHKKFPSFVLNCGFTIEGRTDEELPEVLLGGSRCLHLDLEKVTVVE